MSDHDALLAAILARPDDDLPRLVFADWLDESGHPAHAARAAFIRIQIEAAAHPDGSDIRLRLDREARALRLSFADEWDQLPPPDGVTGVRARGFVHQVVTSLGRLARAGPGLFAVAPVQAAWLQLSGRRPDPPVHELDTVAGLPVLARLRTLRLTTSHSYLREQAGGLLLGLAECPTLTGLARLDLSTTCLGDDGLVRLTSRLPAAAFAGTLTDLDLSDAGIGDAGASNLLSARGLDRLARIDLSGNFRISPTVAAQLRRRFGDRVTV